MTKLILIRSLKNKLIVFVALLMLLLSMVIAALVYTQMRNSIVEGVDHELSGTAQGYSTFVKSWYDGKAKQILAGNVLAEHADPIPTLDRLRDGGDFFLTFIGHADHRMQYSDAHQPPAGYDPTARPWYQQAATTGKAGVTEPYVDVVSGKLCVTFVSPVQSGGSLKAVVGGDVLVDALVKTVLSAKLRGDGFAFLVDRNGKVIAHPNQALTLKPITEIAPELTTDNLASTADNGETRQIQMGDQQMYVQLVPIKGTSWLLGVAMDTSVVSQPMTKVLITISIIVLLSLIILVPIASVVLARMLNGLGRLSQAMREISQGEGDLTRRITVDSQDEIADTASAFNLFVDQLQKMFQSVKIEANQVIDGISEAGNTINKVAEDSRQLSDVSSSNAATLEQITVSIAHIADAANQADALVSHTGQVSNDSSQAMQQISQEMGHTISAVKGLSQILSSLNTRSEEISGITNVIKDIADQTNLLALNAAIEAARAGETGRGFAVVADEVRKLAERTAQATTEISKMVDSIRLETNQAVNSMQQTIKSVDDEAELTQAAMEKIADIQSAMKTVMAKISEISHSTSEQHEATTIIAQSTEKINGRIIDNDAALQGVHQSLSTLNLSASSMRNVFSRFRV